MGVFSATFKHSQKVPVHVSKGLVKGMLPDALVP